MRQSEIHEAGIYTNKYRGFTRRSVIGIGTQYKPQKPNPKIPEDALWVLYTQDGTLYEMTLEAFAKWAGKRDSTVSPREMEGYRLRYKHYCEQVLGRTPCK